MFFWGVHAHDGIWHLALVANAFRQIPFVQPTFAGSLLTGYNYLFDLFMYVLAGLGIPAVFSYFKLIPLIWFCVFMGLMVALARKLKNNPVFVGMLIFYTFFSGSFSFFITLWKEHTIWGSAGLLAQLIYHLVYNPQFSLSLLGILYLLIKIKEKDFSKKTLFFSCIIVFLNIGLKFYGGFVTGILLLSYFVYGMIKKHVNVKRGTIGILCLVAVSALALLMFYDPLASMKTGSIFIFSPFAIVHPITEDPGLLYWRSLTDARYFLISKGIGPRLVAIELLNLVLFLVFYLGVRIFGLVYLVIKAVRRKTDIFDAVVATAIVVSTAATVLFVQRAQWWNTIQFFYYAIFLSTIYLAELSFVLLRKKKIGFVAIMIFIILSVPATLDILKNSLGFPGDAYLPDGEYQALRVLKQQPKGVVLTPLFSPKTRDSLQPPYPLYAYGDTAYVAAFSSQQTYLNDIVQLGLTGVEYKSRLEKIQRNDCAILDEVDYIYYNNDYKIARSLFDCPLKLKFLYGNRTATIYRVKK